MDGGLEGAWWGQRDRGRGADLKGGREGKTNSASEEESVLHKRDSSEQADSWVKCKQGSAAGAKGVVLPVLHKRDSGARGEVAS